MRDWLKFTAWPWIRDHGWPALGSGVTSWFNQTIDHPGVAAFNLLLGALISSLLAL